MLRCALAFLLAAVYLLPGGGSASTQGDAVKSWLASNAIPLRTVEAGHGFADMQPLKKVIGPARIVSLGEATHGTREFFQLKHRMLEFLVREMGFTVFAIEATMPEAFDINEYVLTGKGDPAKALAGLGFWTWDTEEVLAMIEWMRRYNADPQHRQKVKFYGFDMQSAPRAARVALAYLRRLDTEQAAAAEKTLGLLANPYTAPEFANLPAEKKEEAAAAINSILARFDERKPEYIKRTNATEWALARQHARILTQNIETQKSANQISRLNARDRSMAENIRWILEHEGPQARIIVWAHNGHVATRKDANVEWMGLHLRKMFGAEMVVFGFIFNQGSFQAMEAPVASGRGLITFNVSPAPEGSLDATLAAAGLQTAAIDLRALPKEGEVASWFSELHKTRSIGAVYGEQFAANVFYDKVVTQEFDALLFVEKTTAARPVYKSEPRAAPQKLAAPANLDFESGETGKPPSGWALPPAQARFDFQFAVSEERPHSGQRCALLSRPPGKHYGEVVGSISQRIDAAAYRGKRIRLRAAARADVAGPDDHAYLRLLVAKKSGVAFNSLDKHPITSAEWRAYEIVADVPDEAEAISYGLALVGGGRVWLDAVAVEVMDKPGEWQRQSVSNPPSRIIAELAYDADRDRILLKPLIIFFGAEPAASPAHALRHWTFERAAGSSASSHPRPRGYAPATERVEIQAGAGG